MKRAIALHRESQRKKQCGGAASLPTPLSTFGPLHKWGGAPPPCCFALFDLWAFGEISQNHQNQSDLFQHQKKHRTHMVIWSFIPDLVPFQQSVFCSNRTCVGAHLVADLMAKALTKGQRLMLEDRLSIRHSMHIDRKLYLEMQN